QFTRNCLARCYVSTHLRREKTGQFGTAICDIVSRSKDHRMKTSLLLVVLALLIALAFTVCASVRFPSHMDQIQTGTPAAQAYTRGHTVRSKASHRLTSMAAIAPASWATTKGATSASRMPAKVSESALAMVTAGLANEVEAVNQ